MEGSLKKTRIFADFSIEALLKKDDSRNPKPQTWGNLQNVQLGGSIPSYFGESYYNVNFTNIIQNPVGGITFSRGSNAQEEVEEDEEFISVSDDNEGEQGSEREYSADNNGSFDWLTCTRFKPPKLPRPRKKSNCRRNGRGPRIPFSTHQLAVLESTFVSSQYLSSDAISRLADTLNLTETRVKIWFQNRRARYRREKESPQNPGVLDPASPCSSEPEAEKGKFHYRNHPCSTTSQSFRHFINDLNLLAASTAASNPKSIVCKIQKL